MSLKHTILVLLEHEKASGYDIVKKFKGSFGNFWNATHQQVYQELGKLSDAGFVKWSSIEQEGKPDKKDYSITVAGIEELKRWLHTPLPSQKVKDHLMVRMAAQHLVDPMVLWHQLEEQRQRCTHKLATLRGYEKVFADMQGHNPLQLELTYLSLKRGIQLQETWLEWAEEIQHVLEKHSATDNINTNEAKQ